MANNFIFYSINIIKDIIWRIVYFPFWWYSRGLFDAMMNIKNFLANRQRELALSVWVKNIFKPMYGEYNWQGWLISFFVRLFQIIFRSLVMLVWLLLSLAVLTLWIVLPALVFYQILFQLTP